MEVCMENKNRKSWKSILIFILVVIVVLLIVLGISLIRKHLIIQDIIKKQAEYSEIDNYYVRITDKLTPNVIEYYQNGDEQLEKVINYDGFNEISQTSYSYYKNGKIDEYVVVGDDKTVTIGKNGSLKYSKNYFFNDYFSTENKLEYIKMLLKLKITSEKYNGKECYLIDINSLDSVSGGIQFYPDQKVRNLYIEKETGLIITTDFNIEVYEYEFNNVTDKDLEEPDIAEFEVQEN
jgi:hypothetical protein